MVCVCVCVCVRDKTQSLSHSREACCQLVQVAKRVLWQVYAHNGVFDVLWAPVSEQGVIGNARQELKEALHVFELLLQKASILTRNCYISPELCIRWCIVPLVVDYLLWYPCLFEHELFVPSTIQFLYSWEIDFFAKCPERLLQSGKYT